MQAGTQAIELSDGGIAEETELVTADGPVSIDALNAGDRVYALDVTTGLVKLKPVVDIEPFHYEGPLLNAEARRLDFRLHPEQRLPYRTRSVDTVRFEEASDIGSLNEYYLINEWRTTPGRRLETVDITEYTDDFEVCVSIDSHGHSFRAALPEGCDPIGRNGDTGYHFDAETFKQNQDTLESIGSDVFVREGKNHWRRPYRCQLPRARWRGACQ